MNRKKITRRIVRWTAGIVVTLLLACALCALAAFLLLRHSQSFRQAVLLRVEKAIGESTGTNIAARDFDLHLAPLGVDVYNLTVRTEDTTLQEPLLHADRVTVAAKIVSIMEGKWSLKEIEIQHPVVHLMVNAAGENNLPKPRGSESNADIFEIAAQKFALEQGEIFYNDRKIDLDAELHDLRINAAFDRGLSGYRGSLSYRQGLLKYASFAPVNHGLEIHFAASRSGVDIEQAMLTTGASQIIAKGTVEDYNDPKVHGSYEAFVTLDDLKRILKNASLPSGNVHLTGLLKLHNAAGRPLQQQVFLSGEAASSKLAISANGLRTQLYNASARYELSQGNLTVQRFQARTLNGSLAGKLAIRELFDRAPAKLEATLTDVSLQELGVALSSRPFSEVGLRGKMNATIQATWTKALDNLHAHADAGIQAAIEPGQTATPLNGEIHGDYRASDNQVSLHESYLRTPHTSLTLEGTVSRHSQLNVKMESGELHELELLAHGFMPTDGKLASPLGLSGTGSFIGSVRGSTASPEIAGQITAHNLKVHQTSWRSLRADLQANSSLVKVTHADLEAAPVGQITFSGQAALKQWSYKPENDLAIQASATSLSLADLARLTGAAYPVEGKLSANLSMRGSQSNPAGQGDLHLREVKLFEEPITAADLHFQSSGKAIDLHLSASLPAGSATGSGKYLPASQEYEAQAQATNLRLENFHSLKLPKLHLSGGVNVEVSGRGTFKSPELTAKVEVPYLEIQKEAFRQVRVDANLRDNLVNLTLDSSVAGTSLRASGTVASVSPYMANLQINTGRVLLQQLLSRYAPQAGDIEGETEIHASIRGPLQNKAKITGHAEVPVFSVMYKIPGSEGFQLRAAKAIQIDFQEGMLTLQPANLQGTETDIRMECKAPLDDLYSAKFSLSGKMDLRIIRLLEPDLRGGGSIAFDLQSPGQGAIQGQLRLNHASLHQQDAPLGLDNGNGVLNVTRDRIEIGSFQGQVSGGTLTAKGVVAYRPAIQFDLAFNAEDVRLRYPEGIRTVLRSNLALTGKPEAALLRGRVQIDHVSFTSDFDISSFVNQITADSSISPSGGFSQNLRLDIAVQSTSQMNLVSSKVSLQGSANLRVAGSAAEPTILGRANLSGGELFIAGNRYVLQNGSIDFLNPLRTEPVLNLQATTVVDQYNISLNFQGPIEHLHTRYTSDPPLPPVDIINLLAFGKTTEAAEATSSAPGNLGAESVLAQSVSSAVSGRVEKFAGLSHFSIDPTLGGGQRNPGARLAVQQRVTSNLFVTFATDVTSTQREEIQLEYKFNQRWSVSAVRDQNGGFGFDLKFHRTF